MKKTISVLLSFCILFSFVVTGCAAEEIQKNDDTTIVLTIGNPSMTVNGTEKSIDDRGTAPVVADDRTLLPIRAVIEEMGGTVLWEAKDKTIQLNYGNDEIKLTVDSPRAYLNGQEETLDTAPTVINDRTMLPIRYIAESFKFNVDWNAKEQTVTITKANEKNNEAVQPSDENKKKSIVVYFSATGNTKTLAQKIAAATDSDLFEIVPQEPYTSEDLNYNNKDCRANKEHNDENARPEISGEIENIKDYEKIFLG